MLTKDNKTCIKGEWPINWHVCSWVHFFNELLLMNYFPIFLVHPCDTASNGGCNQICKKHMQKYTCACEGGFKLGKDGKACIKG